MIIIYSTELVVAYQSRYSAMIIFSFVWFLTCILILQFDKFLGYLFFLDGEIH